MLIPRCLRYALIDLLQTFVASASWDRDEPIWLGVLGSKGQRSRASGGDIRLVHHVSITHCDVVAGIGRLSAVYVCVCACVCQHSKIKPLDRHQNW